MSYSIGILVASIIHLDYFCHFLVPLMIGKCLSECSEVLLHLNVSHIDAGHIIDIGEDKVSIYYVM